MRIYLLLTKVGYVKHVLSSYDYAMHLCSLDDDLRLVARDVDQTCFDESIHTTNKNC